ncbi:hypothetical protein EV702DRAFT_1049234 [Suillus placidus]|uniref:Uncharacterized protein n=1 Tax=Suillus placidus TaxID=48579 RepID=A0A9P6ZL37_9AGAM|nr:hypothetical protein EV702DRAFT_1049234 [Suillus placidus]
MPRRPKEQAAEGSNAFKLDKRPVQPKALTDDIARKTHQLDLAVEKALMGFGKINILHIKNQLKFGTYNERPQKSTEVNKMITSFENHGRQWFKEDNALAIVIKPARIRNATDLKGNWNDPESLKEVKFEDEDALILASGQHQVAALKKMAEAFVEEETGLNKHIARLEDDDTDPSDADVEEHQYLRQRLSIVTGELKNMGYWSVKIYNQEVVRGYDYERRRTMNELINEIYIHKCIYTSADMHMSNGGPQVDSHLICPWIRIFPPIREPYLVTESWNNMPPKRSKGGGAGGKKTTGDDEGSVLHMNNRPIEALAPKTDIAKETQKLDTQVAKCKVGVAWVNLLDIAKRLTFGVYNDRPENDAEVNKLIGCFEANGIVSMKDVAVIPLILKTSRLTNVDSLKKDFDEPEEVVELELKDHAAIVVASGQHRLAALKKYKQALLDEYALFEKKRGKIRALKQVTQEHVATYNECHEEMGRLKGLLHNIGKWGVIIYDEDGSMCGPDRVDVRNFESNSAINVYKLLAKGTSLANHLSRNSTLHEYKETEEEVLITILKKLKSVYDSSPVDKHNQLTIEHLREVRTAQEKNARLHRVLHHDGMCTFLATQILPLGPHFRHHREFSVNWLAKSLDVCMGIYLSWVVMRINALKRLSSKAKFPSHAEISKLLNRVEAGEPEAIANVAALRESMSRTVKPNDEADISLWASVLESIDKHASSEFADVSDHIGEMTTTYITPLSAYRQRVVKTLQDAWGLTSNEDFEENKILAHLDRIVARVMLYLMPQEGKDLAPLPLLGGFVMNAAWDSFVRIQDGIAEVCRWFETLLDYYRMLHPKTHVMDDWSMVMLNNITKDPRFIDGGGQYAQKVTNIIWTHRRTLMVSPRPKDKKELVSAYERLPPNETIANEALMKILQTKRMKANKNRDLASEPQSVAGMLALHTTSWDWLSPTLKNTARDIEPCMKAIAVERQYLRKYRQKMMKDRLIGALRRLIEDTLTPGVRKVQTMNSEMKLCSTQAWVWWDGVALNENQEKPSVVLEGIKDAVIVTQRQLQERLVLENNDHEAINKLIAYIVNMPCGKSSSEPNAPLSSDVVTPLQDLVTGFEGYMEQQESAPEDEERVPPKQAKKGKARELTKEQTLVPDTAEEDHVQKKKHKQKKVKGRQVEEEHTPVTEPDTVQASSPARPKPKPRPVPRKQRQPSPPPLDKEIENVDNQMDAGDKIDDGTKVNAPASTDDDPVVQRTLSPFHGFSTTDTSWFDPEADEDHNMQGGDGTNDEDDNHADDTGIDDDIPKELVPNTPLTPADDDDESHELVPTKPPTPADDDDESHELVPTQPLASSMLPPATVDNLTNVGACGAAAAPVKRSRAATGNSSSSSTNGQGRKNKKKAKIVLQGDDRSEVTVIPGV